MSDTCLAHFILVHSVAVIFVELYNLRSSSLCIFHPFLSRWSRSNVVVIN
jgi:hypothetical protein